MMRRIESSLDTRVKRGRNTDAWPPDPRALFCARKPRVRKPGADFSAAGEPSPAAAAAAA